MEFGGSAFGWVEIEGKKYDHDVVIERGRIRKRKKGPSKLFRERFGHTPLSLAEEIPWKCKRLVIGTGATGALPVMKDIVREADRREVDLVVLPTPQALEKLQSDSKETNAILHVTC